MNNRIRFGEPIELEIPLEALPPGSLLTVGSTQLLQRMPFQVYILEDAYAEMWRHVDRSPNLESGGVLVGHPFKTDDGQTTFVVVVGVVPQHSSDRGVAHFTVGPSENAAARIRMEQQYPGLIPVGWYHSHPGLGVFLSDQDMIIVRSIYNSPWHIAIVLDTIQRSEGVFVGPTGKKLVSPDRSTEAQVWIGLHRMPDSVKAIALHNLASELQNQGQANEAKTVVEQLDSLVESSEELSHWRAGYRAMHVTEEQPLGPTLLSRDTHSPQAMPLLPPLPQPMRSVRHPLQISWLLLSGLIAFTLAALFFGVAIFWPQSARQLISLGWGVMLSLLAVISAMYVILSIDIVVDVASGRQTRIQRYRTSEHLAAMALIALVILVWAGYVLIQSRPEVVFGLDTKTHNPASTPNAIGADTLSTSAPPTATAAQAMSTPQGPISTLPFSVKPNTVPATAPSAAAVIDITPTSTTTSVPFSGMFGAPTQTPQTPSGPQELGNQTPGGTR